MSKVIQPAPDDDAAEKYRVAHAAGEQHGRTMAAMGTAPAAQGDREAFERWAAKRHGLSFNTWADTGKYSHDNTNAFWECWQAAIAYKGADK